MDLLEELRHLQQQVADEQLRAAADPFVPIDTRALGFTCMIKGGKIKYKYEPDGSPVCATYHDYWELVLRAPTDEPNSIGKPTARIWVLLDNDTGQHHVAWRNMSLPDADQLMSAIACLPYQDDLIELLRNYTPWTDEHIRRAGTGADSNETSTATG